MWWVILMTFALGIFFGIVLDVSTYRQIKEDKSKKCVTCRWFKYNDRLVEDRDYWQREAKRYCAELGEIKIRQAGLGLTDEVIQEYKKFEDECVLKGFSFKSLLEARERQVPIRPRENNCCEICSTYLKDDNGVEGDYCPNCGQKIDWSV